MYEVAYNLGLTVGYLKSNMAYDEFLGWLNFFERRPVGWREDLRTSYLMKAGGSKFEPYKVFPSLKFLNKPEEGVLSIKNSVLFNHMLSATGGDKLEFLRE